MPLGMMCRGDVFEKYVKRADAFDRNKRVELDAEAGSLEGNLQDLSARESLEYDSTGQQRFAEIFFDYDPALGNDDVLKHVSRTDGSLAEPRWLSVRAIEMQGPPGRTLLWVVTAEETTQLGDFGVGG